MSQNFIFSVVIAIYNTEDYLSDAIESILNQTFGFDKIQLILIDDGSTDKSGEICKKFELIIGKGYADKLIKYLGKNLKYTTTLTANLTVKNV